MKSSANQLVVAARALSFQVDDSVLGGLSQMIRWEGIEHTSPD